MGVMNVSYLTLHGQILSEIRNGVQSDYIPDPQGSTAALTNSSQAITDTFTWWPYGELRNHAIGSNVTPFGHIGTRGCYTDSASSRIYERARTFRPNHTGWLTVDPLWPKQKPYVYAHTSPISRRDPSGLACEREERCWDILTEKPELLKKVLDCVIKNSVSTGEFNSEAFKDCIKDLPKDIITDKLWVVLACLIGNSSTYGRGPRYPDPCKSVVCDPCCYGHQQACTLQCAIENFANPALGACLQSCNDRTAKCMLNCDDDNLSQANPWPP